jgi:hypothetical protein
MSDDVAKLQELALFGKNFQNSFNGENLYNLGKKVFNAASHYFDAGRNLLRSFY